MKWFKHNADANRDAKLEKVLMRFGAEGYALYWLCLELIAAPIDRSNITFELDHDAEILAFRLRMDSLKVEEIMNFFVSLGLFEMDLTTHRITCMKLAANLENSIIKNPELQRIQLLIKEKSEDVPDNPGQSGTNSDNCGQIRSDTDTDTDQDQNTLVDSKRYAPICPHEKIINLYHQILPQLPKVRSWTPTRKQHLQARWREYPDMEDWISFFELVKKSPFLMGEILNGNRPPFRASLDWLIKPENFAKTIEGKYHE